MTSKPPKDRTIHFGDLAAVFGAAALISSFWLPLGSPAVAIAMSVALAVSISGAVHHADVIAHRLGATIGTLILAISVTIIEVALIVSMMANGTSDAPTIARDTVFAAVMIVTNGILGIGILVGSRRHRELGFQPLGASSLLAVLAALCAFTFILPNFTTSTPGPSYGSRQLIFVAVTSLVLYGALIWAQTTSLSGLFEEAEATAPATPDARPSKRRLVQSVAGLLASLAAVVGLAKTLSPGIAAAVAWAGAPNAVVGILVAILVLAPEAFAAIAAARTNRLQTSLNLALGSGIASIALTIPIVSGYALATNTSLQLGVDQKSIVWLSITFIVAALTFGNGRTTALHGIVHLSIMISYLALAIMP